MLRANEERFRAKWGDAENLALLLAAGEEL
jgi:hypothetical protein